MHRLAMERSRINVAPLRAAPVREKRDLDLRRAVAPAYPALSTIAASAARSHTVVNGKAPASAPRNSAGAKMAGEHLPRLRQNAGHFWSAVSLDMVGRPRRLLWVRCGDAHRPCRPAALQRTRGWAKGCRPVKSPPVPYCVKMSAVPKYIILRPLTACAVGLEGEPLSWAVHKSRGC
jgi:hypothetical protein